MGADSATKGEWSARFNHPQKMVGGLLKIEFDKPKTVASIWSEYRDVEGRRVHHPIANVHVPSPESMVEQEANAYLLAASKEMYKAIKKIYTEKGWVWLEAILAKAENR